MLFALMAKAKKQVEIRKKAVLGNVDHSAFYAQLGKRIRELRKAKGFKSYETFAYDIEISRSAMSKYESGILTNIEMETLLKIIDGFNMTPREFFSEGFV